jgi:alanine-glyoxylate transaminase/serine-glyoxylate transaminase/serine-pyruvate transaminase
MVETIRRERPAVVGIVHAETSTGVLQPVQEIARAARDAGALTVMDCVTSLAGAPVEVDAWGIDVAHSATQKCLGAPPGLAPVTFSPRAVEAARKRKAPSFYLDLDLISKHWGSERLYHHTVPMSLVYALHEALKVVFEEGLEARWARHKRNHEALAAGLKALGLELSAQQGHRLWMLNAVRVPEGVDEAGVRRRLLEEHGIEIGAGLGPLKGRIWRIGLMGYSSQPNNVLLVLAALEKILRRSGGVAAAAAALTGSPARS